MKDKYIAFDKNILTLKMGQFLKHECVYWLYPLQLIAAGEILANGQIAMQHAVVAHIQDDVL